MTCVKERYICLISTFPRENSSSVRMTDHLSHRVSTHTHGSIKAISLPTVQVVSNKGGVCVGGGAMYPDRAGGRFRCPYAPLHPYAVIKKGFGAAASSRVRLYLGEQQGTVA